MKPSGAAGRKGPWWIVGAAGAFFLTKLKALVPLLKMGSVGGAVLTMLVSVWAYALVAPLELAVGVVILVLVHEMGHVAAARIKKLPTSAPIFIPLVGAIVNMKRHPRDAATEAYIALGGPLLGSAGAALVFLLGEKTGSPLLLAVAYIGFLFNLVNLLPVFPLDGGKITGALSRKLWPAGLLLSLLLIVIFRWYWFLAPWGWLAWDWYSKWRASKGNRPIRSTWATFEVPVPEGASFAPGSEEGLRDVR
ncbi:site-2 protease family protein [Paenibacillus sp. CC-CFT747]|nr:site-2 protease family protein [Paenibacillus sp. CC-CFT747]